MKYSFHPEAEEEFLQTIEYYEKCAANLGYDFALEVYSTIQNVVQYPQAWPVLEKNIRRCQTARFPYGIIYGIHEEEIFILAVMHLHREPGYWKKRQLGS